MTERSLHSSYYKFSHVCYVWCSLSCYCACMVWYFDLSIMQLSRLSASFLASQLVHKTADQARAGSCCVLHNRVQLHMRILNCGYSRCLVQFAHCSTVVQDLHNTITLHQAIQLASAPMVLHESASLKLVFYWSTDTETVVRRRASSYLYTCGMIVYFMILIEFYRPNFINTMVDCHKNQQLTSQPTTQYTILSPVQSSHTMLHSLYYISSMFMQSQCMEQL